MALLKGVKVVPPSTDIPAFDPSDQFLTFEAAESFVADNNNEAAELDSSTTIASGNHLIANLPADGKSGR